MSAIETCFFVNTVSDVETDIWYSKMQETQVQRADGLTSFRKVHSPSPCTLTFHVFLSITAATPRDDALNISCT